jgi:hypothetical protein
MKLQLFRWFFAPLMAALAIVGLSTGNSTAVSVTQAPQQVVAVAPEAVPSLGSAITAFAVPSYFDTSYCNGLWRYAASWGRGCVDDGVGVAQDIRSDTGCVEAKYRDNYGRWLRISGSGDCYGGGGNVFYVPKNPATGAAYTYVRLYHGDGYYRTLSP